jgi:hypothetical protein
MPPADLYEAELMGGRWSVHFITAHFLTSLLGMKKVGRHY